MIIYRCEKCGNIVVKTVNGGGPLSCCGTPMTELRAGATDAALEKHVPYLDLVGNTLNVQVGEVAHPMTPEHYIQFILVAQGEKVQYVMLTPEDQPKAAFTVEVGEELAVYEYCNLHGLWKADL